MACLTAGSVNARIKTYGIPSYGLTPGGGSASLCIGSVFNPTTVVGYTKQTLPDRWLYSATCTLPNDSAAPIDTVNAIFLDFMYLPGTFTSSTPPIMATAHAHLCLLDWHGTEIRCGSDSTISFTAPSGSKQFMDFGLVDFNNVSTAGLISPEWSYWVVEFVITAGINFTPQGVGNIWGIGLGFPD